MTDKFLNFHTVYRKTMWGKIQGEKKFKCDKCPKMFARRGSLVRHIAERKGELQYQCEYCEKMFFVKKGLDYHIDTRHLNQDLAMSVEPPEGEEAPAEDEDFGQISMIVKCKSKLGSKKSKKEGSEEVETGPSMSEIKNLPQIGTIAKAKSNLDAKRRKRQHHSTLEPLEETEDSSSVSKS